MDSRGDQGPFRVPAVLNTQSSSARTSNVERRTETLRWLCQRYGVLKVAISLPIEVRYFERAEQILLREGLGSLPDRPCQRDGQQIHAVVVVAEPNARRVQHCPPV